MNLLQRTVAAIRKSWYGPSQIPSSWPMDWWQRGYSEPTLDWANWGPIRACVSVISQELSRIPPAHIRILPAGGVEPITTSAAIRVLTRPNSYQTRSDFFLNMTRALLVDGNAYAYAKRNGRMEVDSLWPLNPRNCRPYLEPDTGTVFYQVGSDPWSQLGEIDIETMVPARDLLHIRLETPNHPLVGECPLASAEMPAMTGMAIQRNSAAFFANKAQPGGYIRIPGKVDAATAERLQERWAQAHGAANIGKIAVLGADAEYKPITMTAVDAQVAEQYKLSVEDVARVYRVPPFLLGNLENATLTNVEALTRFFVVSGLGWYVDHWEESLTRFFGLPSDQRIEMDIEAALLRADLGARMDAYAKAVQSGVYVINEVRRKESLPPVEYGDDARVQQQLVPLSFNAEKPEPPAPVAAPVAEPDEDEEEREEERAANILYMSLRRALQ